MPHRWGDLLRIARCACAHCAALGYVGQTLQVHLISSPLSEFTQGLQDLWMHHQVIFVYLSWTVLPVSLCFEACIRLRLRNPIDPESCCSQTQRCT